MMDQLVQKIYQITEKMRESLQEENYEQLNHLLNERQAVMTRVDSLRSYDPDYQYREAEKKCWLKPFN